MMMTHRYPILATFAIAAVLTGCDSPASNPQLQQGWVTNCAGPAFSKFGGSGPGPERPVFKITDQLVLAVPKQYHPSANSLVREPRECTKIGDLPQAHFVQFIVQGDWSAGHGLKDIPTVEGGLEKFRPDRVWVRVEPEWTSRLSPEQRQDINQYTWEFRHNESERKFDVGALTCLEKSSYCYGSGTKTDPDVPRFTYHKYSYTSFVLLQGDYPSSRYGRIHVYWQTWTSDIAHGFDVDQAIFNLFSDWNISNTAKVHPERG